MMQVHYLFVGQTHHEYRVPHVHFVAPRLPVVRLPYSGDIAPKTGMIIGERRDSRGGIQQ
jgi:hypothetical protein